MAETHKPVAPRAQKPEPKMTDILRAAADAAEDDGEDFDTGPLQPEEDTTVEVSGTLQEAEFKAGDYVTATFTNGALTSVEHTDQTEHDPVLLRATALGIEFGPANEFTERRIARLREDQEELRQACLDIDTQIAHLNARRTDAMRAFSGVSADLTALGVHD